MALRLYLLRLASLRLAVGHGQPQLVLDDMDTSTATSSANMVRSSCGVDAYKGQFHTEDNSKQAGETYFEFKFDVSRHGCYSLEEFHPSINASCSPRLASSARLDVDWCKGRQSTLTIDQSRHGGRWNFVGIFPFYVGWQGVLRLSKAQEQAGDLLASDAFRLNWIGDRCTQDMETKLWYADQAQKGTVKAQMDSSKMQWQAGSLRLSVKSDSILDSAGQLANLRSMTLTIEGSLKKHFGALAVNVQNIQALDARRLAGCRRLQTTGHFFEVSFRALLPTQQLLAASSPGLVSKLFAALAGAGAKVEVESAEVSWMQPTSNNDDADRSSLLVPIVIGAAAFASLLLGVGVAWLYARRAKASTEAAGTASAAPADVEAAKEVADTKDVKIDEVDDNASTITPESDRTE